MKYLVLINFKNYPEAIGAKALPLAKKIAAAKAKNRRYEIAVAPSLLDLKEIAGKTKLKIFSQHADLAALGPFTGRTPAKELRLIGVKGTILNHSEHKISFAPLKKTIDECRKEKLITVVCASNLSEAKKIAAFHPHYLAYEPKELIGGNISVTEAKPEIIAKAVRLVKKISPKTKVLCGAGVHSRKDLQQALHLGAKGIMLSHAVVKARNPEKFLDELLK